ncbi:hypothetical protein [Spirosoma endophyticum]|uniref:Lipoprotein n=1 Tax=Spirosoma endophyticum TaxID=662367 RepID=A0A1I2H7Y0_9BACT|nr:hypothetical protein [Spirosoma endophyticum]SFF26304.1 hypothetical protein SAMN05216167_13935 [Spirosoma endophyticum]
MKKALTILVLLGSLMSCHEVQPSEIAATVIGIDPQMCGLCGGWFVRVDSTLYRADIPTPYAKANNPIWLRYQPDERPNFEERGWITIKSVRQR